MTGNVVFALAAGPAMIAALTRFRERFEWRKAESGVLDRTRSAAGVTMIVLGALLFTFGGPGSAQKAEAAYPEQATKAATWLKAQQNTDGGFGSAPEASSSINITARAMFALAATGTNPLDVRTGNISPYGYLVNNHRQVKKASDIALTILALRTVGQNPKKFNGRNLIKALRNHRGNGSFGNDVNVTAFSALAFRSAGAYNDAEFSVRWLYKAQNDDGGWGIARNAKSDADSTGTALMAITGKKVSGHGVRYLNGVQRDSGGFVSGSTVNSQSTGLAIQGVVSTGRGVNYLKKNGNTAAGFLISRQQADGSIWYSRESDQTRVWVTADATTALAGKPLPIGAPPREKKDPPASNNGTGGSTPGDTGTSVPGYNPSTPLPPASMVEPSNNFPSNNGNGGNRNNGSGSNGANNDPGYEEQTTPLDPSTAEPDVALIPDPPSEAVLAASKAGSQPSPLIAILIALGVTGGLAGGTILLARRFRW